MGLLMFTVLVPWVAHAGDPWVVHDLLFVIYGQLIGRSWGTYGSPVNFYSSPTGRPWSHVGIYVAWVSQTFTAMTCGAPTGSRYI